jgi:hypothetical protein
MEQTDLENRFAYHKPDDAKAQLHSDVRGFCLSLAFSLNQMLPDSREKSLAITSLEETMLWANAALARMNADGHRL